jgi:hypothetical protein
MPAPALKLSGFVGFGFNIKKEAKHHKQDKLKGRTEGGTQRAFDSQCG